MLSDHFSLLKRALQIQISTLMSPLRSLYDHPFHKNSGQLAKLVAISLRAVGYGIPSDIVTEPLNNVEQNIVQQRYCDAYVFLIFYYHIILYISILHFLLSTTLKIFYVINYLLAIP